MFRSTVFLSTPSARRATPSKCGWQKSERISIHALREEGDQVCYAGRPERHNFYPRPPRGGRLLPAPGRSSPEQFLSTPSARRATRPTVMCLCCNVRFLSTPSARRATDPRVLLQRARTISIHALREEGDRADCFRDCLSVYFYPRPPRGGRLKATVNAVFNRVFLSTPSARRATIYVSDIPAGPADFYPRPPRGGRR